MVKVRYGKIYPSYAGVVGVLILAGKRGFD
jgi:hypothetical protein